MKNDLPKDWDDNPEWTEADFARAPDAKPLIDFYADATIKRMAPAPAKA